METSVRHSSFVYVRWTVSARFHNNQQSHHHKSIEIPKAKRNSAARSPEKIRPEDHQNGSQVFSGRL